MRRNPLLIPAVIVGVYLLASSVESVGDVNLTRAPFSCNKMIQLVSAASAVGMWATPLRCTHVHWLRVDALYDRPHRR
jgi:hypothetical protein